jgi:hypothetical protein
MKAYLKTSGLTTYNFLSSNISEQFLFGEILYMVNCIHVMYNDQRNAQVFNLFIYLLLPYMFRAFC